MRGEFGYWVFEGDWQPRRSGPPGTTATRTAAASLSTCSATGATCSTTCSARCASVPALGATHIPERVDEKRQPYAATADDAAYAHFETRGRRDRPDQLLLGVRVDRDELLELQVDGTDGQRGRRPARAAASSTAAAPPSRSGTPTSPARSTFRDEWQECPTTRALRQRLQGPVGAVPAPRRARRAVPVGPPRGGEGRPARRAGHEVLARAPPSRRPGAVAVTAPATTALRLPRADGSSRAYRPGPPSPLTPRRTRRALRSRSPPPTWWPTRSRPATRTAPPPLDWEATLAFRRHLWAHGFRVAEAMDTAQRGMGLDWAGAAGADPPLGRRGRGRGRRDRLRRRHRPPAARGATLAERPRGLRGAVRVRRGDGRAGDPDGEPRARGRRDRAGRLRRDLRPPAAAARAAGDPALARRRCSTRRWTATGAQPTSTRRPRPCSRSSPPHARQVDGVKVSLLDARARGRHAPRAARRACGCYTGDDFNYPELIRGDEQATATRCSASSTRSRPPRPTALAALDAGDARALRRAARADRPARRATSSRRPPASYKTGVVFLAYLNGHQAHFRMVGGAGERALGRAPRRAVRARRRAPASCATPSWRRPACAPCSSSPGWRSDERVAADAGALQPQPDHRRAAVAARGDRGVRPARASP